MSLGAGLLGGLAALAQPITARVLIALGLSVVTIGGVQQAYSALRNLAVNKLGGLPADVHQLGSLLGLWEGIGIVLGAASFAVAYWALTKSVQIAGVQS